MVINFDFENGDVEYLRFQFIATCLILCSRNEKEFVPPKALETEIMDYMREHVSDNDALKILNFVVLHQEMGLDANQSAEKLTALGFSRKQMGVVVGCASAVCEHMNLGRPVLTFMAFAKEIIDHRRFKQIDDKLMEIWAKEDEPRLSEILDDLNAEMGCSVPEISIVMTYQKVTKGIDYGF